MKSDRRPIHDLISAINNDNSTLALEILKDVECGKEKKSLTTALLRASARGNLSLVKALFESGAEPNGYLDQIPLIEATRCRSVEVVKYLLEVGANPDKQDENSYTALMYAVSEKMNEIAVILLQTGANPETETYDGVSAIEMARKVRNSEIFQH